MFATCTFQEFDPGCGGIPVRSSNGKPRFLHTLRYQVEHVMPSTFPDWAWVKAAHAGTMGQAEFFDRYARMIRGRVDQVREEAEQILQPLGVEPSTRVVLLCFDRLDKPGNWCHRTAFGQTWSEITGEDVPELGRVVSPELRAEQYKLL
ncbi:hypothetical protein GCM10010174_25900 [Kutzneria viridogrisea]|uniref:DUF488 family protein n=1 Tax=Kutzneria viridogrisea TaxID=47990 RepID=A0ABR6BRF9_9PSEU|nr:hypothetical protein [Kutzneria viridogrisea]